jgi:lysophospholipase L1-like esterase
MNKTIFRLSILLNVILLIGIFLGAYRIREHLYQKWIIQTGKASMVMFGDSHTARGNWNFSIKNQTVLRLGYSGFTTDQLLGLIPIAYNYMPDRVFILCGGNDIGDRYFTVQNTLNNFKIMADDLRNHNIEPVFQKLPYGHNHPSHNKMIDTINMSLEVFCKEQNIDFLDICKDLHDSTGLKLSLTVDNVHLNKQGYKLWCMAINNYLKDKK